MKHLESSVNDRLEIMGRPSIGIPEIMKLFGVGRSKAGQIKKSAEAVGGKIAVTPNRVKTTCVYKAMGIDLAEETARLKRQL